ncbi:unnamed protein product [Tuber aestivum]|uniref:SUN domain-containing protein n=1 Tax=Tuber aestivum TaxID=59557 RepID=A0A292Q3A4_9PEZI|nr:unnamed protein product [Tuber aestivum]
MFTATPPSAYRRRSSSRRIGSDGDQRAMPFIPTKSSYSYGSPHSNMPKAPQLADTKVPMAVALQQKQDAAEARMRAEEREREGASGEQPEDGRDDQDEQRFQDEEDSRRLGPTTNTTTTAATTTQAFTTGKRGRATTRARGRLGAAEVQVVMNDVRLRSLRSRSVASDLSQGPPTARSIDLMPPPPPLANGRQQSEISDRSSIGVDTTLGFNRSYGSEDDIDPALGKKVSENLARGFGETEESEVEEPEAAQRRASSRRRLAPVPIYPAAGRSGGAESGTPAASLGFVQSKVGDSSAVLAGKRARELERERLQGEIDSARLARQKQRELLERAREAAKGTKNTGGGGGEKGGGGDGGGGGGTDSDDVPFNYFGFANFLWQRWLGVSISRVIKTIVVCFFATILIHYLVTSNGLEIGWPRSSSGPTYIPPSEAPKNIDELVHRLHTVERELGNFGHLASSFETKYRQVLEKELLVLEDSLTSAEMESSADRDKIRNEINSLSNTLDTVKELQNALLEDNKRKLDKLYSAQQALDQQLSDFKALQKARDEAMQSFEGALPKQMVATLGPDGKVQLTDEFKDSLQDVFSKIFPKHFKDAIAGTGSSGIGRIPSWEAFIKGNEDKLKDLIEKHASTGGGSGVGGDPGGVVLSRGTVMAMVQEEAKKYHQKWEVETFLPDFESKFESQLEELQRRIRRENTEHFNSASSSILAAASAIASGTASRTARSMARDFANSHRGRGSTERISLWATLPDYASIITGASVWPYVTSPSYDWTGGKGYHHYVWRLFGRGARISPPPVMAITPSTEVGECWPFPERSGDIGIKLATPIYVSHVTVDHVPKQQAIEISSAPKNIEFWIRVPSERKEELQKAVGKPASEWYRQDSDTQGKQQQQQLLQASANSGEWVRVHEFMYDIHTAGSPVQTFELPVDLTMLNITSRLVAFRIVDNWGHPNFTCLYRVRVHGYPPRKDLPIGEEGEGV